LIQSLYPLTGSDNIDLAHRPCASSSNAGDRTFLLRIPVSPPKTANADVCLLVRVRFKVIRLVFRVTVRVTLVLGLGLLKLLLQLGVGLGLVVKVSVWVKIILKAELV